MVDSTNKYSQANRGTLHGLAIRTDGTMWGAGWSRDGQLGFGRGDLKNVLTLTTDDTWEVVDSWDNHTMAIRDSQVLYGTGSNSVGELGLGDYLNWRYEFDLVYGASHKQVACGAGHSIDLRNISDIYGTGENNGGQLGLNDTTDRLSFTSISSGWKQIAAGSNCTMVIKDDDTLWVCGDNDGGNAGQLE